MFLNKVLCDMISWKTMPTVNTHGALSSAWLSLDLLHNLPKGIIDAIGLLPDT